MSSPTSPAQPTSPTRPTSPSAHVSPADALTPGLAAAALGAVLAFISSLLTWSTVTAHAELAGRSSASHRDYLGISGGRLGTETLICALAALVVVGVMLLPATRPWAWTVLLGFGALIALLALIDMLSIPKTLSLAGACPAGAVCSAHRSVGAGVWFTLVSGLLVVAGALVHHRRPVPLRALPGASGVRASGLRRPMRSSNREAVSPEPDQPRIEADDPIDAEDLDER